jgi:hypothetical protein
VVSARAHLGYREVLHATVTFYEVQIGPDLPVDFLPGDAVCLSNECDELLKVPILINNVLSSYLSIMIYNTSSFAATEHLALLLGK